MPRRSFDTGAFTLATTAEAICTLPPRLMFAVSAFLAGDLSPAMIPRPKPRFDVGAFRLDLQLNVVYRWAAGILP